MMDNSIKYHTPAPYLNYFFDKTVRARVGAINQFLRKEHEIHVFPEATIKNNRIPNGLLIKSEINECFLMPALLRDPGCGFLLFKIKNIQEHQLSIIASQVMDFCQNLERLKVAKDVYLLEVASNGVKNLANNFYFDDFNFPTDLNCLYLNLNLKELASDVTQITNSLELKILNHPNANSLIGFIHTGSEYFPKLISSYWSQRIAAFSYKNKLATSSQIKNGIYGLPYHCDEAYEYQQWVTAAMNYCLFKRWWIFNALRNYLQSQLNIEIIPLADTCHAGLFFSKEKDKYYTFQTRGVQLVKNNGHPYLLAGQRESISYLINTNNQISYLGHGTSYKIDKRINPVKILGIKQSRLLTETLRESYANTAIQAERCLAYNYNILMQGNFLRQYNFNLSKLLPLMNYQGKFLRQILR